MQPNKSTLDSSLRIDTYIDEAPEFSKPICRKLRTLILKTDPEITEEWKWGPNYQRAGMVCGFGAFKQHVTLTFFQGALLSDPYKLLTEGLNNQHNRGMKFKDVSEINEKILAEYIKEAIGNNLKGIKSNIQEIILPDEIKQILAAEGLLEAFEKSTYTFRKDHIVWIQDAKKPETREKRVRRLLDILNQSI